jgi:hypothetical protein
VFWGLPRGLPQRLFLYLHDDSAVVAFLARNGQLDQGRSGLTGDHTLKGLCLLKKKITDKVLFYLSQNTTFKLNKFGFLFRAKEYFSLF